MGSEMCIRDSVMSVQMLEEINVALDDAERQGGVVILTGREKMFSGGFDLSVFKAGDKEQTYTMLSNGARLAERDGGEWVVNGQKVWTTLAHHSNIGMLLTRTNPDAPKHKGLSYFILDMHAPGVEVRPLYQITGEAEFNEVFLTDVRVPDDQRLGDEGDGWRVAITTLMNERVALGGGSGGKGGGPIRSLMNLWNTKKDDLTEIEKRVMRDRVADLWGKAEILRLTNQRAKVMAKSGDAGPGGSIGKLFSAELNQKIFELCIELEGAEGMLHANGYPMIRSEEAHNSGSISGQFLRSRANTIEGGTSEIMRNILGERVLGLPGDVRVDKDVPWSDIPR